MNTQIVRNLLTGLLAYQSSLISRVQLIAAIRTWIDNKERDIGHILFEQQAIVAEVRDLLIALTEKQIAVHNDEPLRGFDALTSLSDSLTAALQEIDDADVNQAATLAATPENMATNFHDSKTQSFRRGKSADSPEVSRFSVIRPHAKGGLGEVFLAFDHELNRQVALKEIQNRYSFDEGSRARFLLEAEITGGLEHPGIVPVYGLGTYADGRPFYAMRFIKGMSLAEASTAFHRAHSPASNGDYQSVEFRQLLGRFIDVCLAIEYAHSRGVLHRDLKPGNIMLGKYGETLVVDWGLAKTIDRKSDFGESVDEETLRPSSGSDSSLTRMGQAVGTPSYMSPEAASGKLEEVGVASDVFCLGATLYHLLTGKAPYEHQGKSSLDAVKLAKFPSARDRNKNIPLALEAMCLKAMKHRADERYPSAKSLADDMESWLGGEPISAYVEPLSVRVGRFVWRHRTIVSGCAIAGIMLFAGSVIYLGILSRTNQSLRSAHQQVLEQEQIARTNADTARGIAFNIMEIAEEKLSSYQGQEGFREKLMDQTYELFSQAHKEHAAEDETAWQLARVSRFHGNLKQSLKKKEEAKLLLDESIALQTGLNRADQKSLDFLAETYRDLGSWGKSAGDLQIAADALGKSTTILDRLLVVSPNDEDLKRTSGTIDMERVGFYMELLNNEAALESAVRCESIYVSMAQTEKVRDLDYVIAMLATSRRGQLLALLNRNDESRAAYSAGIERGRGWLERSASVDLRYAFARNLLYFASDLSKLPTLPDDAEAIIDEANERFQILVETRESITYRYYLACCHRTKAVIEHSQGKIADAQLKIDQSIAEFDVIATEKPSGNYHAALAEAYHIKSQFMETAKDAAQLRLACEQAVKHQRLASESSPESLLSRQTLVEYEKQLASL